jgi:serine/threonine protein kinase
MMKDFPDFTHYGYQIKRELGQNRAGGRVTYLATEINTQRSVVVKQFQFARTGASWSEYDAFEREIQVLRRLDHPSIPQYLDSFQTPAGFCMVQEYKDAPSLATSRRWTPQEIKQIAISVLEILKYLQSQLTPVIHRDLKPENILVDERLNVFLVDFGFARTGGGEVAASSVVKGTLGFMPPEQMFNRHLSAASDLYSLGATLICLLTNTVSTEIGTRVDDAGRINFKQRVPKLNPGFIEWLQKMVEPNVRQRYPNAAEALDALIPLQVLRPAETSKVLVVAGGLLAVGVAFCVPVVMKFSAPEVEPQKVEEQNAGEVIVTADPKSVKNTDSISLNQKRVYFSVKINTNPPKSQAIGTCQLFDSAGILVAMGQSPLQVSESGLLSAYCWYDFKKIDSAGNWTFKFNVDGQKAVQKNLLVLYIQPQPTPPEGREEG